MFTITALIKLAYAYYLYNQVAKRRSRYYDIVNGSTGAKVLLPTIIIFRLSVNDRYVDSTLAVIRILAISHH